MAESSDPAPMIGRLSSRLKLLLRAVMARRDGLFQVLVLAALAAIYFEAREARDTADSAHDQAYRAADAAEEAKQVAEEAKNAAERAARTCLFSR